MTSAKRRCVHLVYPGSSFFVGCGGAGRTENCPKVVGPDWDVPMSPMLKQLADGRTLAIFATKPGDILALDVSRRGATAWHIDRPSPPVGGGAVWGGAMDESTVYVPGGPRGIAAFAINDGQRKWSVIPGSAADAKVEYTAAVTAIPGVLFAGASDGGVWAL